MKKISYVLFTILVFVLGYFTYLKAESLFFKSNKSNAKKDEVVKIVLDFNSIEYDKFNVLITSSDSVSKLQTSDISAVNTGNNELSFDIDKLSMNINKVTFSYKISSEAHEGDTIVFSAKITEITESEEQKSMTQYVTITVEKDKKENPSGNNNNFPKVTTRKFSFTKVGNTVTYNGSDNNYLNSLSVKGYSLNKKFAKESNTYFVTVKNSTTKIKINYKKSSSKSKVIVTGNTNLKVGVNKVLVTVNAENGESRVYRIYVTREESK